MSTPAMPTLAIAHCRFALILTCQAYNCEAMAELFSFQSLP